MYSIVSSVRGVFNNILRFFKTFAQSLYFFTIIMEIIQNVIIILLYLLKQNDSNI